MNGRTFSQYPRKRGKCYHHANFSTSSLYASLGTSRYASSGTVGRMNLAQVGMLAQARQVRMLGQAQTVGKLNQAH